MNTSQWREKGFTQEVIGRKTPCNTTCSCWKKDVVKKWGQTQFVAPCLPIFTGLTCRHTLLYGWYKDDFIIYVSCVTASHMFVPAIIVALMLPSWWLVDDDMSNGLPGHHTETTQSVRAAISAKIPSKPERSIPATYNLPSTIIHFWDESSRY